MSMKNIFTLMTFIGATICEKRAMAIEIHQLTINAITKPERDADIRRSEKPASGNKIGVLSEYEAEKFKEQLITEFRRLIKNYFEEQRDR